MFENGIMYLQINSSYIVIYIMYKNLYLCIS